MRGLRKLNTDEVDYVNKQKILDDYYKVKKEDGAHYQFIVQQKYIIVIIIAMIDYL